MAAPAISATQHSAIQQANQEFLAYATDKFAPVQLGTIPSGSSGGSVQTGGVTFNPGEPPPSARWADELQIYVSLPYTITVPTGATALVSSLAPWCALINRLSIAGSPPWDNTSLVPFWLDSLVRKWYYAPENAGPAAATAQQDTGPFTYSFGNASVYPGASLAAGTYSGTLKFTARIILQRRLGTTFGMIPLGQANDRPLLQLYLSSLVGPFPEQNLIQDPANAGVTASLTADGNVTLVWRSKGLDQLPEGIRPAMPTVGLGLEVDYYQQSVQNAGQYVMDRLKSAMLYQYTYDILVNAQKTIEADYFAVDLTGETQNARVEFDATQGNFQCYYTNVHDRYLRLLPSGVYVYDMVGGEIPFLPTETPYIGTMASDEGYANLFGIAYTPAAQTVVRFPAGTSMSGAYVAHYRFGYVEVPY